MKSNLRDELESSVPESLLRVLHRVTKTSMRLGMPLYIVGGVPRDLLLSRQPEDFDLVVEGDAIELAGALAAEFGGKVVSHWRFSTATWHPGAQLGISKEGRGIEADQDLAVDLITARKESYSRPAALPQVSPGSIEDDLRRRDFSINAIAIRLDGSDAGEILDPLHGVDDVSRRLIRVLHPGSFDDDPTRLFRAVRYASRLAFRLSPDTVRRIPTSLHWIQELSAQRLRHELDLALGEDEAAAAIQRMASLGILEKVHPALPHDREALRRLRLASRQSSAEVRFRPPSPARNDTWTLWLMGLTGQQLRSLDERLHFGTKLGRELAAAGEILRAAPGLTRLRPSDVTRRLDLQPRSAVVTVHKAISRGTQKTLIGRYLDDWSHIRPSITGAQLRDLGVPPGPVYRTLLDKLRGGWVDGRIKSAEDERAFLHRLLERRPSSRRAKP